MLADTSIPKPKDGNVHMRGDMFQTLVNTAWTGQYSPTQLTPDQRAKLMAWRPPREGESNYAPGKTPRNPPVALTNTLC
jgi:hypothetical protein